MTVRRLRPAVAGAALLAAAGLACDDATAPTGRGPGGIPILEVGEPVTGTVAVGGTNSFLVVGPLDTALRVFLRATSGSAEDSLLAQVARFRTPQYVEARAASVGSDESLDEQPSQTFRLAEGDTMLVTVRARGADDGGPYTVVLRMPDARPERAPAALVAGDTLATEAIDRYGDIDEFTFSGAAGDEVIVFLRAASGRPAEHLGMRLVDPAGQELRWVHSFGSDVELTTQGTFPVRLATTGTYRVVVHGAYYYWDDTWSGRGPYELLLHRVNRAPESGSAVAALGDTVAGSIEAVGDVDEYTFSGVAGEQIEVNLQLVDGFGKVGGYEDNHTVSGGLFADLRAGTTSLAAAGASAPGADLDRVGTGRVTLPATREYTVRIVSHAVGTRAGASGRYRFELYRVDPRPEQADASVALGDTVVGEHIERPADVDEFRFSATAGAQIAVFLSVPDGAGAPPLAVQVLGPSGEAVAAGNSVLGFDGARYVGGGGSGRFVVPTTGSYTARVSGAWARQPDYPVSYVLEAYPVDLAPESVPAALLPGDVVAGERIDRVADVDRFVMQGTAGDEVVVHLRRSDPALPVFLLFDDWYPVTAYGGVSPRLTLTRTGEHPITVRADLDGPEWQREGAYEFEVYRVNRAPESLAATYVIGDTVTGERLDRVGDIDEFTFTAAAGERLRFVCEAGANTAPRSIVCSVFEVGATQGISGVQSDRPEEQRGWGDFTVERSGTYRLYITGWNDDAGTPDDRGYRAGLERLP